MVDSIAKILYDAAERASWLLYEWSAAPSSVRESAERGAHAVALHVLEAACPSSPILAAMWSGASFEEAVERAPGFAPSDHPCRPGCTVACEVTEAHAQRRLDAGRAFLAEFRREERAREKTDAYAEEPRSVIDAARAEDPLVASPPMIDEISRRTEAERARLREADRTIGAIENDEDLPTAPTEHAEEIERLAAAKTTADLAAADATERARQAEGRCAALEDECATLRAVVFVPSAD